MARVLLYHAHPGQRHSQVNAAMLRAARTVDGITCVDLYARYPRFDIDVAYEQDLLVDHDIIIFQHPIFWYSTPSLIKEWLDLVLEHGFAYGAGGDQLAGKMLMQAISTAGAAEAYRPTGYQNYTLREFLRPMEQTARLCQMTYLAPFVLHGALDAIGSAELSAHTIGFVRLLELLRDDLYDTDAAEQHDIITHANLPVRKGS